MGNAMSQGRGAAFRWALALASTLISLLLVEGFIRVFLPAPHFGSVYVPPQKTFFAFDDRLGWRGRPNATGSFSSVDFEVTVSLDALGFRNTTPVAVESRKNWLLIGDSFGWGWGVEDDETVAQSLMRLEPEINVYNLSSPGFGTDQQFLTVRGFLEDHPSQQFEGLVLLFCDNDIQDVGATRRYGYRKSKFVLKQGALSLVNDPVPPPLPDAFVAASPLGEKPRRSLLSRSHLYNLTTIGLPKWLESRRASTSAPRVAPRAMPTAKDRRDLEVTMRLLSEMAALTTQRELSFHVVLLLTDPDAAAAWQWNPLSDFMTKQGIAHSRFQSGLLPRSNLWLDGHLSVIGNRQLARHVLASLAQPATRP
jgi:hypothetical protein